MTIIQLTVIIIFNLLLFSCEFVYGYPSARITTKVIDENGKEIKGADVHISFEVAKKEGWGTDNFGIKGVSDSSGLFSGEANASSRVGITVRKKGFYFSRQLFEFTSSSNATNRWEPWNPTVEVVLKKKRNPVPMYMKGGIFHVPKFDVPIGYDLEKGDWVMPYGEGKVNDFVFLYHAIMRAYRDYECSFELSFSNDNDGIQEYAFDSAQQSFYKWPFEAPENNYEKKTSRHEIKNPGKNLQTDAKKDINYIFRVRTNTDNSGKIIEAKYGKLKGEFGFDPKGNIQFHYYFNPDGTSNLEEDLEKNLFKQ